MYMITKTCKIVPKIITKVRLDFRDGISIWWHPLLAGFPRHLCTSQTEDRHVHNSGNNLAQTKKEQGWSYDPTIKYEALRQCAVPKYAYYDDSATDRTDSSDSEIEIETMTEEEAQARKDKILAEAKEEEPFPRDPYTHPEILKKFFYLDSPDSLNYANLILYSDPKEELESKLDKFHWEIKDQIERVVDKAKDQIISEPETEPEAETELEIETGTDTMVEEEAHNDKILTGAKVEHLFCYDSRIKCEPLKRYIVPRFAFFDSSSTDWSDSSSFSDSGSETETMAKKEVSQEDKILSGPEEKQLIWDDLAKPPTTDFVSEDLAMSPSVKHGAKTS